jgi:hypothetical protein
MKRGWDAGASAAVRGSRLQASARLANAGFQECARKRVRGKAAPLQAGNPASIIPLQQIVGQAEKDFGPFAEGA